MKNIKLYIIIAAVFFSSDVYANLIMHRDYKRASIFFSHGDKKAVASVVKGLVHSFSTRSTLDRDDLFGRVQSKSSITVRLYNTDGLKTGDRLYIINKDNLVVSGFVIHRIFKSNSFGEMLIGYGNFRLSNTGDRVVQRIEDEYSKYAYIHKSRGDYYRETGNSGRAISEYKNAIKLDKGNPEAHLALGYVYYRQNLLRFAFREFQESYKRLNRLYDNEDRFRLLKGMADIRYRDVYHSYLTPQMRIKFIEEGKKYSREALGIYPDSVDAYFYLGVFNYKTAEPSDKLAKNYFLKVVKLQPDHVKANVFLSELYFKHKNREKARMYAENALMADPANTRAKQMMKYIENYNR